MEGGSGTGTAPSWQLLIELKAAQPSLCAWQVATGWEGWEGLLQRNSITTPGQPSRLASVKHYSKTVGQGRWKAPQRSFRSTSWWAGAVCRWECLLQRVWRPPLEDVCYMLVRVRRVNTTPRGQLHCCTGQTLALLSVCYPEASCTAALARHLPCCLFAQEVIHLGTARLGLTSPTGSKSRGCW